MPRAKPSSIWSLSIAGLSERPTLWRISTRRTFISPVVMSIITWLRAAWPVRRRIAQANDRARAQKMDMATHVRRDAFRTGIARG
jgi:hypothetical protein